MQLNRRNRLKLGQFIDDPGERCRNAQPRDPIGLTDSTKTMKVEQSLKRINKLTRSLQAPDHPIGTMYSIAGNRMAAWSATL